MRRDDSAHVQSWVPWIAALRMPETNQDRDVAIYLLLGMVIRQTIFAASVLAGLVSSGFLIAADDVSRRLIRAIDFGHADVAQIERFVADGQIDAALDAWRAVVVNRLRRSDLGRFDYHDHMFSESYVGAADLLVGRRSDEPASPATESKAFVDLYGMSGPSGWHRDVDWAATVGDPIVRERSAYGTLGFSLPLVAAYCKTLDREYARKWFEIIDDFARRQKVVVERIPVAERRLENAPWIKHAVSSLHQADRMLVIMRSLAAFAKSLPSADGSPQPSWARSLRRIDADAATAALDAIPAEELAAIALSVTEDHTPLLLEAYLKPGELPNQRLNGLMALLMAATLFPEIKGMKDVGEETGVALSEYLQSTFYVDGGMFEQSLNYNLGDLEKLKQMRLLAAGSRPPWLPILTSRIQAFILLLEAIRTPAGESPIIGNNSSNPPALWTGAQVRESWFARKAVENPQGSRPTLAGVSSAFPYSGYYVQRRDGGWDSPFLFFMNARPTNGHHAMDNLAIEVHAYGRPLLVRSGPPFYTPKFLPPAFRSDATAIEEYFGEGSSFKLNTVVVDGKSQCRSGKPADSVYESPIAERWHSSDEFDLVEGVYDLGYGVAKSGAIADGDRSVSHRRRVIFVRRHSLWIIADTMLASDRELHEYTRIWKFPPRLAGAAAGHTPVCGFGDDEVILDSNGVHTTDAAGPNLWILNFGHQPLQQRKFFGERLPYRGWYARHLGDMTPSVDVHATWTAAGASTQVAVLWPRPDASPPPIVSISKPDTMNAVAPVAFTIKLRGDVWIAFAEAAGERPPLTAGPVQVEADMLVAIGQGQAATGLVIGAGTAGESPRSISGDGKMRDTEFVFKNGEMKRKATVRRAAGFRWSPTDTGLMTDVSEKTPNDSPLSPGKKTQ